MYLEAIWKLLGVHRLYFIQRLKTNRGLIVKHTQFFFFSSKDFIDRVRLNYTKTTKIEIFSEIKSADI